MADSPVHVVTGGGSGIGAGVCRQLASAGASVVVVDRNLDAAEAVAAEVDGTARQLDVTDEDAVERVYAELGPIAGAVNCAGFSLLKPLVGATLADWHRMTSVHLDGTFLCLRAAAVTNQGTWVYEPAGLAGHWVPRERATVRYFLRRCFHEGRGKAGLAALDGAGESTSTERHYARHVLPRGVARGVRDVLRGDGAGALRSAAITAGFGVTVAGFAVGILAGGAR